jgi:hypothetical protein
VPVSRQCVRRSSTTAAGRRPGRHPFHLIHSSCSPCSWWWLSVEARPGIAPAGLACLGRCCRRRRSWHY